MWRYACAPAGKGWLLPRTVYSQQLHTAFSCRQTYFPSSFSLCHRRRKKCAHNNTYHHSNLAFHLILQKERGLLLSYHHRNLPSNIHITTNIATRRVTDSKSSLLVTHSEALGCRNRKSAQGENLMNKNRVASHPFYLSLFTAGLESSSTTDGS